MQNIEGFEGIDISQKVLHIANIPEQYVPKDSDVIEVLPEPDPNPIPNPEPIPDNITDPEPQPLPRPEPKPLPLPEPTIEPEPLKPEVEIIEEESPDIVKSESEKEE